MNSRTRAWLLVTTLSGCAGFHRGQVWNESENAGEADDDGDGAVDDGGPDDADSGTTDTAAPEGDGSSGATGRDGGATQGPSFDADVLPLLRAGCERCHASGGEAGDTDFVLGSNDADAYETTLELISLDDPGSSRLLSKTAGKGHTAGVIYDDRSSAYAVILDWIETGASP